MANKIKKTDQISEIYYKPLERAEKCSCIFFYLSAILSCVTLIINKDQWPKVFNASQTLFLVLVIFLCLISILIRLYLAPRAQEHRYKDFLSHAYNIPSHEKTKGYYNNNENIPFRRIGIQTLESSFYSKNIIVDMLIFERIKFASYLFIWFILLINRSTELNVVTIVTQIIFSEFLLSRWFLTEWLRYKFEKTFENLFTLFKNKTIKKVFESNSLEMNVVYEMAKANSSITLSEKVFMRKKNELDREWKKIMNSLGI